MGAFLKSQWKETLAFVIVLIGGILLWTDSALNGVGALFMFLLGMVAFFVSFSFMRHAREFYATCKQESDKTYMECRNFLDQTRVVRDVAAEMLEKGHEVTVTVDDLVNRMRLLIDHMREEDAITSRQESGFDQWYDLCDAHEQVTARFREYCSARLATATSDSTPYEKDSSDEYEPAPL